MTITLRATKGSALTHPEMDENFQTLQGVADSFIFAADPDYGVVADGVTDDTTALNAAFAAADAVDGIVVLPQGTVVYNGTGWNGTYPQIIGAGATSTIVSLGASSRLIDSSVAWGTLRCERLRTSGGLGAIRNTYTGTNVAGKFFVRDCEFRTYTKAAIETNSDDNPYWTIVGNIFYGANYTTSMGIALAGWADSNYIVSNGFLGNKVHIKLGRSGHNCYLHGNDFLRYGAGTARIDVWVVPVPSSEFQVSGTGFYMSHCKFGNENIDDTDYKVLYADEGSGTNFGDRLPVYTASTGLIYGHTIKDCGVFSAADSGETAPYSFIYTTTPAVRGCKFTDITLSGSPPKYLVEYASAPAADIYNQGNIFGPVLHPQHAAVYTGFKMTNGLGVARIVDPVINSADLDEEMPLMNRGGAVTGAGFTRLMTASIQSATAAGAAAPSKTSIADAEGGTTDATRFTFTAGVGYASVTIASTPVAGVPVWIEFDIGPGTDALSHIKILVYATGDSAEQFADYIIVPAATRHIRRSFVPRSAVAMAFRILNVGSEDGTVDISRLRVYQAREPAVGNVHIRPMFLENLQSVPTVPASGMYLYPQGGHLCATGGFRPRQYTVATLPSAVTSGNGCIACVTDANATTARSTVAGGGANKVLVMSDGTNWLIVA